MTKEQIFTMVSDYFASQFEIPRAKITPEANLFEDLGLDSIDALDMIAMLESELGITIEEEALRNIRLVSDVTGYIFQKLQTRACPPRPATAS
jgi:acyl carrier protein